MDAAGAVIAPVAPNTFFAHAALGTAYALCALYTLMAIDQCPGQLPGLLSGVQ